MYEKNVVFNGRSRPTQVLFGLLADIFSVAGADPKICVRSSFYQNVVNLASESDRFDKKALDIA